MSPMESEKESIEPEDRLWTVYDAARYVGVHVQTIRKWVRLGKFPRIPSPGKGKDFRFTRELIDEWVKNRALEVRPK